VLVIPLNDGVPQSRGPVVLHEKYKRRPLSRATRYSSFDDRLHLLMIDAISVGALVRYTQASKVAEVPGVRADRSLASA